MMSRGSKPTQDSHAAGAGPQSRECKSVGAFLFAISAALVVLVWRAQGPTSNSETSNNMVAAAEAEHAVTPTPRTLWSSRQSSTALLQWLQYQQELANRTKTEDKQVDVVFLGDSIFESFLGTSVGHTCERCAGVPQSFKKHFGDMTTMVRAISGDQTQHLLWRILNDGGQELVGVHTKAIVLCIGTNNLGIGMSVSETARGVAAVVQQILRQYPSSTKLLLCTLLPRNSNFQARVAAVNHDIGTMLNTNSDGRVLLSDCAALLTENENGADSEAMWHPNTLLMPDMLHPGSTGMDIWLPCLRKDLLMAIRDP